MSSEPKPVGYQLRHARFGLFQGELMGMGFWYDDKDPDPYAMPEQGILEIRRYEDIAAFRAFLCSADCDQPLNIAELSIEPFDKEFSDRLKMIASGEWAD